MRFGILIVLLFICGFGFAATTSQKLPGKTVTSQKKPKKTIKETFESRSIGHLVTSNNNTLGKNEIGAGTMYMGYGFTENLTIATSPFVYSNFEMANFMSRWATHINSTDKIGFDFAYFKTVGAPRTQCYRTLNNGTVCSDVNDNFEMEAWSTRASFSRLLSKDYRLSITGSYFYYINEVMPFSLRMDPQNDDKFAMSLTTLHEFKMSSETFINLEAGFWGLNYTYPYYHLGATLNVTFEKFHIGVGGSTTFNPNFPAEKAKEFAGYDSRGSVHPEVQIQAFF